jgi:ribonuclease BN (tRNA processing enzyme)
VAQSQCERPRRGRAVETVDNPTLTVLGSSCSIPRPARASSAYLLETPAAAVVADLGTGGFANLVRFRTPESIDAVVISHMHADHFIDIIPLRYALRYGARTHDRRVRLLLPPGGTEILHAMVTPFAGEAGAFLDDVFAIETYDVGKPVTIGDITLTFAPTKHYIDCFAMRFATPGLVLVYSSDTAPEDSLAGFARDATFLLCEATLTEAEEAIEPRGHLSSREAGLLAMEAGAKALFLSHYPASANPKEMARAAAASYNGPIHVLDDADRIDLVVGFRLAAG